VRSRQRPFLKAAAAKLKPEPEEPAAEELIPVAATFDDGIETITGRTKQSRKGKPLTIWVK
jgi:hypothetical protein